ncbi:annexin A10 [Suncus etruscus]|uniref:annexin A10 n=1 Tax=Suncus etruscus TaxID=109475 RepID=UPI0021106C72|nr:annexin A10 [Suncus etruscus]
MWSGPRGMHSPCAPARGVADAGVSAHPGGAASGCYTHSGYRCAGWWAQRSLCTHVECPQGNAFTLGTGTQGAGHGDSLRAQVELPQGTALTLGNGAQADGCRRLCASTWSGLRGMHSPWAQGTIFPAPNFNPMMDAQMLEGAFQGFGCDKDMLIGILTQRCNAQRQMIAEAYQSMYGRDLIGDLKENLSDHFKDVMVGLMYPPPSYDAHELWHAMKGMGTDENCLIDILASRTNGEIFQMQEAYSMQYNNNLQEDIYSETSGHFRDTLINLVQV